MDFSLNEDQRAFQNVAREFAKERLKPMAAEWDEQHHFPVDRLKEAGELGFMGMYTPESSSGFGLKRLDSALVIEALAEGCTGTAAFISIHNMATWMLGSWGSETVIRDWLPKLTSGELLASYCLTEPGAGSDAANLATKAARDKGDWVLSGSKVFISGAGSTDILLVMARTGSQGPKGITAFMVPSDLAGIEFGKNEPKMGWRCQPTRMITFDNVRIPDEFRLSEEGSGFTLAMKGLDGGRINIGACSLGTAKSALSHTFEYVQERKQFGKSIAAFQNTQFELADLVEKLEASKLMIYQAADMLDKQDPRATAFSAMAKRFATDAGFDICNRSLQLHGGYGYISEYPLERHVRDTRVHQILEGTNEIMRLIVSRYFLDQGY